MKRRTDLTTPRQRRRVGIHYDPDAFGSFSESIARFLGTGRYLVIQSIVVVTWVIVNIFEPLQFDGYPFIFLTLILLAQNRQEDRDNEQLERDRGLAARTQADTEYLARELAGVRLVLADLVTMEDLREQTDAITEALEKLNAAVLQQQPDQQPGE